MLPLPADVSHRVIDFAVCIPLFPPFSPRSLHLLLGPSHHVYLRTCALSQATKYRFPNGEMTIDQDVYSQLKATGEFELMSLQVDEDEHSLEMHCPYILATMGARDFTLVPIMVGALNHESEARYCSPPASHMIRSGKSARVPCAVASTEYWEHFLCLHLLTSGSPLSR